MNSGAGQRQTVTTPGSLEQALAHGEKLLQSDPDAALQQAQVILRKDGREPRALRIAAAAHRARGEADYAARAEQLAIHEARRYPQLKQATDALQKGDFGRASQLAAEHLRQMPGDLAALTLSAESALGIGLPDKAEPLLREVLERAPGFAHASVLLVNALMLSDQLEAARSILDALRRQDPDSRVLLALENRLANGAGRFDDCVLSTSRLVELDPNRPDTHADHADALRFAGDKAGAIASYREALALSGGHARSWWSLADLDASAISGDDIDAIGTLLRDGNVAADSAVNLHFAAALGLHAQGRFDQAFAHFSEGNRLRRQQEHFDGEAFHADALHQLSLAQQAPNGGPTLDNTAARIPVFMAGMPRSGSTLLERMLSRSPAVEAMGELQIIPHMVKRIEVGSDPATLRDRIAAMDADEARTRGEWYRERLAEFVKTDARFAIDKMHMNWRHLAFILKILPEAKVIDIRRDAMDCCWSNYRTLFSKGHPASNDLADIGLFYRTYARFMDGMRELYPDRILPVGYEELVDEPEAILTQVCKFLCLPFDAEMLQFHRSSEPVATASSEQVRQPLNRRGIGAWRNYADHLAPLERALQGD